MKVTTFKIKDGEIDKTGMKNTKVSVFAKNAPVWGDMLICDNCNESWNDHAPVPKGKVPAGMCLTEANLKVTGTYIIA